MRETCLHRQFLGALLILLSVLGGMSGCKRDHRIREDSQSIEISGLNAIMSYEGWYFSDDPKLLGRTRSFMETNDKSGLLKAAGDEIGVQFFLFTYPIGTRVEFNTNVNLVVEDISAAGDIGLDEYIQASLDKLPIFLKDAEIISQQKEILSGIPVGFVECKGKQTIGYKDFPLSMVVLMTVKNKRAYIFTGTTLEKDYEAERERIFSILRTLKPISL